MDFRKILSKNNSIDIETCLPYGLIIVMQDGMISWVNEQFLRDMETQKDIVIASHIDIFFEDGFAAIERSANAGAKEFIKRESTKEAFEVLAKNVEYGYVVDIRKTAQKAPVKTFATVDDTSNKNKNNLIIKIANDIKSPLQSIMGFSQALLDGLGGAVNEKQEKYTKIIYKNSDELLYLTDKFTELAKSEMGLIEKDYKILDVENLVQSVVRFTEQLHKDEAVEIKFESDPAIKKTFHADENGIKLAVQNVLEAVLRYMDLGNISVVLSVPSSSVLEEAALNNGLLISIICSGFSLSEAELNTIFNPYTTSEGVSKRFIARSIALTSVKNIVNSMSGQMWITSEILKNTTFNILIPINERD